MKKLLFTGLACCTIATMCLPAPVAAAKCHSYTHKHTKSCHYYVDTDKDGYCDYYYDNNDDGICDHCYNKKAPTKAKRTSHHSSHHGGHH